MTHTELIEQFLKSVAGAAATAERIPADADRLSEALLHAAGDDAPIFFATSNDVRPELFASFRNNGGVITVPTVEQMRTLKVGVTDAFCGIASTGSVCVTIGRALSGPASSLTRKHIAVVDGSTIVPRPRDVFSGNFLGGKGLHRSFSFITGPSATADMGPLVRGVHGPAKLHVIVLG
jgi:L-lactate dehydrogenase complex protein LldG